jgi:prolyl oligopeptidase
MLRRACVLGVCLLMAGVLTAAGEDDPFIWLEDIGGQKALEWVKAQNAATTKELEAVNVFKPIYNRTLQILDSKDRIATPSLRASTVYNFWQDSGKPS